MCGICGFFWERARISNDTLESMNLTLVRRGPDEGGAFQESGVGLAMRRLSIIDLAKRGLGGAGGAGVGYTAGRWRQGHESQRERRTGP